MLPFRIRQRFLLSEDPLIRGLFTASGTKTALAAEAHLLLMCALGIAAAVRRIAHDLEPTGQHSGDVCNDGVTERISMFGKITPPRLVRLKQLFNGADGANDASMQWWKRRMGTLAKALRIGNMAT